MRGDTVCEKCRALGNWGKGPNRNASKIPVSVRNSGGRRR